MEVQAIRKDWTVNGKDGALVVPSIIPAYRSEFPEWAKVPAGTVVRARIVKPRKITHHNQLFAILQYTFDNLPEGYESIKTFEVFRSWVLLEIGWCDVVKVGGEVRTIVRSIAFDAVGQDDFLAHVYKPTIDYCAALIGMPVEDIMQASQEDIHIRAEYGKR